jgi:transposase
LVQLSKAYPDRAVWAEDEARFGLKTWHQRRWMALGYRPDWVGQQRYEWFYLYGAIEPLRGRSLFWLLPDLTRESVQFFVQELRRAARKDLVLIWDGAGGHRSVQKRGVDGVSTVLLPPASPQLNPVESVWRILRKKLANRLFESLEALQEALMDELRVFWEQPQVVISLTAYPWWRKALQKRHH